MGSKHYFHFLPTKCVSFVAALRPSNLTNSMGRKYKNNFFGSLFSSVFGAQMGAQINIKSRSANHKIDKSDGLLVKIGYPIKLTKNTQIAETVF